MIREHKRKRWVIDNIRIRNWKPIWEQQNVVTSNEDNILKHPTWEQKHTWRQQPLCWWPLAAWEILTAWDYCRNTGRWRRAWARGRPTMFYLFSRSSKYIAGNIKKNEGFFLKVGWRGMPHHHGNLIQKTIWWVQNWKTK